VSGRRPSPASASRGGWLLATGERLRLRRSSERERRSTGERERKRCRGSGRWVGLWPAGRPGDAADGRRCWPSRGGSPLLWMADFEGRTFTVVDPITCKCVEETSVVSGKYWMSYSTQ